MRNLAAAIGLAVVVAACGGSAGATPTPAPSATAVPKPFVFGGIISITACYFGLATTGGTEGVGQSTTRTVVTSSILILVVDYFLTQLLLSVLSYG